MYTKLFQFLAEPLSQHFGASAAKAFGALKLETVGDLLRHLPRSYMTGTDCSDLRKLSVGEQVAVMAKVIRTDHYDDYRRNVPLEQDLDPQQTRYGKGRHRLEAVISDGQGQIKLTFFGRPHLISFWRRNLHAGTRGIFTGKVGEFRNQLQMTHPQFVMLNAKGGIVGHSDEKKQNFADIVQNDVVPIYPASAKLPTWTIAACIQQLLPLLPNDDPLPTELLEHTGLPALPDALRQVHLPKDLEQAKLATRRLVFDEAFGTQLTMAYRRSTAARSHAVARPVTPGGLVDRLRESLPFRLTEGQQTVVTEISEALARTAPMNRLLQGEVGSGKTLVALLAMLQVVDAGGQAVLFAPTEVLARQHYANIVKVLGPLVAQEADLFSTMAGGAGSGLPGAGQVHVTLLTGSMSAVAKKNAQLKIASGQAGLVIGTHALLSERVKFADLGLVVVDEQHRFGVGQRTTLVGKAEQRPHVLVMTATPIPRSVAMTMFGDLDISTLREMPGNRKPITSSLVQMNLKPRWVERAWERLAEEVAEGHQVFVVAPRIEPGEKDDASAKFPSGVLEWHAWLEKWAAGRFQVAMLHGALPDDEQAETMRSFVNNEISVLVATTIIEVGVDVPNATMMIITEADRFGVSQLHQLRGRVGRGDKAGLCLFMTTAEPDSDTWQRLVGVASTNDGFALADLDLAQRREGDILGEGQSGISSSLRLLRVLDHQDLISQAHDLAQRCLAQDVELNQSGLADYLEMIENMATGGWGEAG